MGDKLIIAEESTVVDDKDSNNVFYFPAARDDIDSHRAFAENLYPAASGDPITVVLSAGKVGSQSVVQSLKRQPDSRFTTPVYHLHMFADASKEFVYKLKHEPRSNLDQIISGHALRCVWERRRNSFRWKFISGVRDPISQLLSLHYMTLPKSNITNSKDFVSEVMSRWSYISTHFEKIYEDIIGIDVFQHSFDAGKGYVIIKKGNVEIFVYKLEKLNEIATEAMMDFLGIPNFRLFRANEAKNLPYKEAYERAVSSLEGSFEVKEFEKIYSHKVVTHFYSGDEIAKFRKRWTGVSDSRIPSSGVLKLNSTAFGKRVLADRKFLTFARKPHMRFLNDLSCELYGYGVDLENEDLKRYQDLLTLRFIIDFIPSGSRILDIGGGDSRILKHCHENYECWNLDKLEGLGKGPKELLNPPYRLVRDYMGNFNRDLPDNYFDFVVSISALEHVPSENRQIHNDIIEDINRVLKPGGYSLHLLDSVLSFGGSCWVNGIVMRMFEQNSTINSYCSLQDLSKDSNVHFMSESYFEKNWAPVVGQTCEQFGKVTSLNILWQKPEEKT